ncbi:MAG: hypothetical protein PVH28_03165 [Desulfobacterales bacterium]|jgi:hypothetical protein
MSEKNRKRRPLSQPERERIKKILLRRKRDLRQEISDDIKKDTSGEYQDLLQAIIKAPGDKALAELIRACFLASGLCRNVNCVLDAATAQQMETQINLA